MDSGIISLCISSFLLDIYINLAQSFCHFTGGRFVSPLQMGNENTGSDSLFSVFDPEPLYGPGIIIRAE